MVKNKTQPKGSLLLYIIFLIAGILISGLCLDKFIVFYYTDTISLTLNNMVISGAEAFFSTFTFFIAGLLFIIYGILSYNKLLKSKTLLRTIATILLIIIVLLCLYYGYEYYSIIENKYMWN